MSPLLLVPIRSNKVYVGAKSNVYLKLERDGKNKSLKLRNGGLGLARLCCRHGLSHQVAERKCVPGCDMTVFLTACCTACPAFLVETYWVSRVLN